LAFLQLFAGAYQQGSIPPVGSAAARNLWRPASADESGAVTGDKINVFRDTLRPAERSATRHRFVTATAGCTRPTLAA
jgi:hypothetical protein